MNLQQYQQLRDVIIKTTPKLICKNCYGKGYATVMYGYIGHPDFIGDKGFYEAPSVHKHFCKCPKGRRLKRENTKAEK